MPFHICSVEIAMVMSAIPFVGICARSCYHWLCSKFSKHDKCCGNHDHE